MDVTMARRNNTKVIFSVEEDEKIVEWVSEFPCLFDLGSLMYKNQKLKDSSWKKIAERMERSVEDCKKRWRNIKDTYHKRQRKGRRTGFTATSNTKQWPLADKLLFLDKVQHKRKATDNNESDDTSVHEDVEDNAEIEEKDQFQNKIIVPSGSMIPSKKSLRRVNKRQKHYDKIVQLIENRRSERNEIAKRQTQSSDDDIDLFFKSIAMSVKKLRPDLINEAKMTSLQMLFDLESRNTSFVPPS